MRSALLSPGISKESQMEKSNCVSIEKPECKRSRKGHFLHSLSLSGKAKLLPTWLMASSAQDFGHLTEVLYLVDKCVKEVEELADGNTH